MASRQRTSPFQDRGRNERPKLKFNNPRDTTEFVLSQDKTDYTYSRSPSYSLGSSGSKSQEMDSYEIPYMSRRSLRDSQDLPSATPQKRQPSMKALSSHRRSARLAGRPLDDPLHQSISTQYPSNYAMPTPGGSHPNVNKSYHGSTRGRVPHRAASDISRSGLFTERDYEESEQSITHMYGLDEYDDSELSDTESSQANHKLSSTSKNTDSYSERSERRMSIDIVYIIKMLFITTIYLSTYLPRTIYRYFTSRQEQKTPISSKSSTAGQAVFSFFHSVSYAVYMLVARSLLLDVWVLAKTREWLSSLGLVTPFTAGLKQASSFTSLSSSSSEQTRHLKARQRRAGVSPWWILLIFLLLPILTSLYLFWGFVPFFMPLVRNETNEEPLAAVSDGISIILPSLGEDRESSSYGAPGVAGAAGCLQCLRREDLTLMIGGLMKENTEKLHHQIMEQNKQILLMLKHGSEEEKKMHQLQLHVASYQKQMSAKRAETLTVDSSVEEELVQMRAELRNLMHQNEEGLNYDQNLDSVQAFKTDMDRLTNKVSNLNEAFEESKNSQDALKLSLQNSRSEMGVRVTEAMEPVLSLQDSFQSKLGELEERINGLNTLIGVFESSGENKQDQSNSLMEQINVLERDVVDVGSIMRRLDAELENLKLDVSNREESGYIATLRDNVEKQNIKVTALEYQWTTQMDEFGNAKLEILSHLNNEIRVIGERTQAVEKSYMDDKELFGVMLQKTSEINSQQIKELSSKVDSKLQSILDDGKGIANDDIIGLRHSIQSNSDHLQGLQLNHEDMVSSVSSLSADIERNTDALKTLEGKLTGLNDVLNGTDGLNPVKQGRGVLMVIHNLQTVENDLQSLRLKVEGMQSLQASVAGSDSISEAVLEQLADLQATTLKLKGEVTDAVRSVKDINSDVDDIKSSLGLLQDRTASLDGSLIDFVKLESELESVLGTVVGLQDELLEIEEDSHDHANGIAAVVAENSGIKELLTSDDGEMVNLSMLQSNLNTFQTDLNRMEDTLSSLQGDISQQGERLGQVLTDGDYRYQNVEDQIKIFKSDIVNMKVSVTNIGSTTDHSDESGALSAGLVDLGSKVTAVEAGLAALRQSGRDGHQFDDLQKDVDALMQQVATLRQKQDPSSESDGLGVTADFHAEEDITSLKSDLSKLNAQYNSLNMHFSDCCQNNKSDMLGFGFTPGYGFFDAESSENGTEDTAKIKGIVYGILNQYSADKTGMVDYALESAGGSVVSTRCAETFTSKTALLSIFGIPLWYVTNSPRTVIQPDVNPGNCWAFKGAVGFLVIQLSDTIKPTYFTMEHIPKSLSPTGNLTSAPRNFSVWSLNDEYDTEGVLLGEYVYDDNEHPVQVFPVTTLEVKPTMIVELKIHSNYGSLEYTCLYRFRVHGDLYRP